METATSWIGQAVGTLNPGYLTLSLIRPALDLFRSETMAPNLSALMIVMAAALIIPCWRARIRPACRVLDERIAFLKGCHSPGDFYDKIDQFDLLMMKNSFLAHGWSEFIETCLFTRRDGKVNVEISIRPGVFINLDDAEHSGLRLRWLQHLPGIFVGLGLLLTFIGLVAALYFSSAAISLVVDGAGDLSPADQTKAIQRALAQLLNTATFKFLTSIAGLGCSIVLGFFQRRWTDILEQKFQGLCRELERCTAIITPEQLANRQHHELCTQTEVLKGLPALFAPEFARALESALETALAPMVNKLDETSRTIAAARQEPLHAMAEEFSATVAASAGREIKAVAETLAVLPEQITSAALTLGALPSQMAAATADLQGTLSALSQGMAAFQARVVPPVDQPPVAAALAGEITRAIDDLKTSLGTLAARPDPAEKSRTALSAEVSSAVHRIEASLAGTSGAIKGLLEGLRVTAAEGSRTSAQEQARSTAAMAAAAERLGASLDGALRALHERSAQSSDEVAGRFLDAVRAAQEASFQQMARIEDVVERIAGAGRQAGQDVGQAAVAAASHLERQARDAATEMVGGSHEIMTRFSATVERLWQHIDGLGRALDAIEGRLAGHAAALDGVNRSARETETAFAGSARALTQAATPLARVGETMAHSMTALTRTVEGTADTLKESQHQGQNLAADLRETLHRLQAVWQQHESRFSDVDDSLSRVLTSIIEHVDAHGAALRDHVVKIDTHLAQTVSNLAGNVEALQETASELTRTVTAIHKLIEALPALTGPSAAPSVPAPAHLTARTAEPRHDL